MIFHSCKTKTVSECIIQKEERGSFVDRIQNEEFTQALSKASDTVHGKRSASDVRQYQSTFSLPMKRNLFGLLTIPVFVNHVACTFIIDTGAQISGIKEKVAKQLQLHKTQGSITVGSAGGKQQQMHGVCASSLQFGGIEYHDKAMIALHDKDFSLRFGKIDLFSFDGILGWDILSTIDFELDDISKQFKVLKNCFRFDHPNMIHGGFPLILAKVKNGDIAVMGFDSGAKMSWLGDDAIQKFGYQVKEEGTALGFGVHGLEEMPMKIIAEAEFDVYKAHIHLTDTTTGRVSIFPNFVFDGVFGNEISKGRRIRFVNSKEMVLLA